MRLHAIQCLREIGPVDVFGSVVGRPVEDKAVVAGDYRFVLCFENDVYPGYVTEKPFEAWATGAVPLWRGSDAAGYLNRSALINASEFPDLQSFAEVVAAVDGDEQRWVAMAAEPILRRQPDLNAPLHLLRRTLAVE